MRHFSRRKVSICVGLKGRCAPRSSSVLRSYILSMPIDDSDRRNPNKKNRMTDRGCPFFIFILPVQIKQDVCSIHPWPICWLSRLYCDIFQTVLYSCMPLTIVKFWRLNKFFSLPCTYSVMMWWYPVNRLRVIISGLFSQRLHSVNDCLSSGKCTGSHFH